MRAYILAGVKNIKQVSLGIQHILADVISKNSETMSSIKKMYVLLFILCCLYS